MSDCPEELLERGLERLEELLGEALSRTPSQLTVKQLLYNAYQLVLALRQCLSHKGDLG